jgi:geranylgeranyl diphosphate synthase, type II
VCQDGTVSLSDDFDEYLRSRQSLVEEFLRQQFRAKNVGPARLVEAISYSLLGGGKRLRPILVLMASEAAGGVDQNALPAAAAVEMIHTYSLIHDDLPAMDDDDLRRGRPTCHKVFGEAMAILAGDALLTWAFEVLASQLPPTTAAACCRELARGAGAAGMVGGQVEDLDCENQEARPGRPSHSLETLRNVHALKTGALFRACLRLGILAAQGERPGGPDSALIEILDGFGRCFGMIFQITDDLIDVEGTSDKTGKRTQKDAGRGKLTYPGFLGLKESRQHAQELADQATQHLHPLGSRGQRLAALVKYTLSRDR